MLKIEEDGDVWLIPISKQGRTCTYAGS